MTSSIRRRFLHSAKCRRNDFSPGFAHFLQKRREVQAVPLVCCEGLSSPPVSSVLFQFHYYQCKHLTLKSRQTYVADVGERDVRNVNICDEI